MLGMVLERIVLHRKGDPENEYRELSIKHFDGYSFSVWQLVGFASNPDTWERSRLKVGSESDMRSFLKSETHRLCSEEGFTIVES